MGCWNPSTLLDLIETGIDVFDSSYPFLMAENSNALVFLCDNEEHNENQNAINLSEKRYIFLKVNYSNKKYCKTNFILN